MDAGTPRPVTTTAFDVISVPGATLAWGANARAPGVSSTSMRARKCSGASPAPPASTTRPSRCSAIANAWSPKAPTGSTTEPVPLNVVSSAPLAVSRSTSVSLPINVPPAATMRPLGSTATPLKLPSLVGAAKVASGVPSALCLRTKYRACCVMNGVVLPALTTFPSACRATAWSLR